MADAELGMVQLVLTMSSGDAQTFVEDWQDDPSAPVLTGGWQEHPVAVTGARVAASEEDVAAGEIWQVRVREAVQDAVREHMEATGYSRINAEESVVGVCREAVRDA